MDLINAQVLLTDEHNQPNTLLQRDEEVVQIAMHLEKKLWDTSNGDNRVHGRDVADLLDKLERFHKNFSSEEGQYYNWLEQTLDVTACVDLLKDINTALTDAASNPWSMDAEGIRSPYAFAKALQDKVMEDVGDVVDNYVILYCSHIRCLGNNLKEELWTLYYRFLHKHSPDAFQGI